jgi:hypothetical protein
LKKVLSLLLLVMTIALVTGGYFVFERYSENPEQILPYPYSFVESAPSLKLDAPILIAGDRMGLYFSKFSTVLADTISQSLAKPIKIQSIAKAGHGLHRTLHELKSLTQWPQILIFQGASEEFFETKFIPSEIPKIKENFKLYNDDRIETFLILYPWLSRFFYGPVKRVSLGPTPVVEDKISEEMFLRRLETELMLFKQQLIELVSLSKNHNTLLILTTTPINLDESPRKVCEFTRTTEIDAEILGIRDLLKANNPKMAYTKSSKLITQYSGNAELMYIHGQVAKRLRNLDVAKNALLQASAYDCEPWRATELQNSIIRKVAKEHQVLLFDFARLVEKDFAVNTTFFDEIHPQNLYYDAGMNQLGLVIKSILKL